MLLSISPEDIALAALLLKKGELVAFPTETVYGLGAPIFSPETIRKIFTVKGRPQDNPLIAHVGSVEEALTLVRDPPAVFFRLAEHFFPGPLTLVLSKQPHVSSIVSGGGETIALRMPSHLVARALIQAVGEPLVAPSANLSGKPSSTEASHVLDDFHGKIGAVIDGGPCPGGLESTVLSLVGKRPCLLRPGSITLEEIQAVAGEIDVATEREERPLSPGMKYRHYAPLAPVMLFKSLDELERYAAGKRVRRIVPRSTTFYAELREADRESVDAVLIYCDSIAMRDAALMNRVLRAAGQKA